MYDLHLFRHDIHEPKILRLLVLFQEILLHHLIIAVSYAFDRVDHVFNILLGVHKRGPVIPVKNIRDHLEHVFILDAPDLLPGTELALLELKGSSVVREFLGELARARRHSSFVRAAAAVRNSSENDDTSVSSIATAAATPTAAAAGDGGGGRLVGVLPRRG